MIIELLNVKVNGISSVVGVGTGAADTLERAPEVDHWFVVCPATVVKRKQEPLYMFSVQKRQVGSSEHAAQQAAVAVAPTVTCCGLPATC